MKDLLTQGVRSSSSVTSPSLGVSLGVIKKRKKNAAHDKELEFYLLKSQKKCLELRVSELEDKNHDLESDRYSLCIEMRILKTLCEKKLLNFESKNRSSEEINSIKEMVFLFFLNI